MLPVPTPFAIGAVNAYLIEGDPLTLIDNGPDQASSLSELERLVGEVGHRLEDVEKLVVTHHHADHLGLTELVARRTGAEVVALDEVADYMADFDAIQHANDRFAQRLMRRHGIDRHVVDALGAVAAISRRLGGDADVDRRLADGDTVRFGDRTFTVLHRPGHSSSDTVFHDAEGGLLISGDHLLSQVSSNAIITQAPGGGDLRTHPLVDYRRSLRATAELDVDLVAGGHGPPITGHRALIERRLGEQVKRAENILELLRIRPMSAHEIASTIWERIAFTQAFLTLSEVLGHIDLLIADGRAVEQDDGETVRFAAA